MTTHAIYSASSLERLSLCPVSARLSAGIESKSSEAAMRGTRIHALAEQILKGEELIKEIPPDELEMANQYAEYIESIVFEGELMIEVDVTEHLKAYNDKFGGTADAVIHHGELLEVIDLKTGMNPVTVKENKQLLTYCLGAINRVGWKGIKRVRLHIWQPNNVSMVEYPIERMKQWEAELVAIGQKADDPFAKANPSPKACFYCLGKVNCDAIREKAVNAAKGEFMKSELEQLLDDAELAIMWGEAIKEEAKNRISNGENAGKWYLKGGRKLTDWADKFAVEDYFAGKPNAFEIKSPAAIKKLGMEIPEEFLKVKETAPILSKKSD